MWTRHMLKHSSVWACPCHFHNIRTTLHLSLLTGSRDSFFASRLNRQLAKIWTATSKVWILLSDFHTLVLVLINCKNLVWIERVPKANVYNHFTTWDPFRSSSLHLTSRPRHQYDNKRGKHACTAVFVEEIRKTFDYASHHISIGHQTPACDLTEGNCNQLRKL